MRRKNGTFKITKSSLFGATLLGMLSQLPQGKRPVVPDGSYLEIKLSRDYAERYGTWLSQKNQELVASWLKADYERQYLLHIKECRIKWGLPDTEANARWRAKYGIDEDMRPERTDLRNLYRKTDKMLDKH
jgi:hypothetical protein